nr:MAG TPA: Preprotein translocase secA subunit, helicase, translocation, secretion, PROTEIN.18A [Caudoviricetes sp.]
MILPAFCTQCGQVVSSGISASNSVNITISGCTATCPYCGGEAHTIEGTFNFVGNTIEIIKASNVTKEKLQNLKLTLEKNKRILTKESFEETLNSKAPELSGLASIMPKTRDELYAFIGLIITIIGFFLNTFGSNTPSSNINIETVNNYIIYESTQENEIREQQILPKAKTGRNELCPCGSGKKYKFCCYEQDRSQNK